MIVHDAFYGFRRFKDFKDRLGITQVVLSDRLSRLTEHGILSRYAADVQHPEYRLAEKCRNLFPLAVGFAQWGDRWIHDESGPPILIVDQAGTQPVSLSVRDSRGREIGSQYVNVSAAPGANDATLAEFARIAGRRQAPQHDCLRRWRR
jgi:DNA-binding HxlR family transcriptional regulator